MASKNSGFPVRNGQLSVNRGHHTMLTVIREFPRKWDVGLKYVASEYEKSTILY